MLQHGMMIGNLVTIPKSHETFQVKSSIIYPDGMFGTAGGLTSLQVDLDVTNRLENSEQKEVANTL